MKLDLGSIDLSALEVVSIDGELALVLRLGRSLDDGIPMMERYRRAHRVASLDDPLRTFLPARTDVHPDARVKVRALFAEYEAWAYRAGVQPIDRRTFRSAMLERGFKIIHSNGQYWQGIRSRSPGSG